jgi:hypothetical protein
MTANNIACVLPAAKFDEFGALSLSEERLRLENLAIQLKAGAPVSRGWIMVYGVKKRGSEAALRRAKRIKQFLVKEHKLTSGRVLTAAADTLDGPRVEVWISFVGQSLPGFSYSNSESDRKRNE